MRQKKETALVVIDRHGPLFGEKFENDYGPFSPQEISNPWQEQAALVQEFTLKDIEFVRYAGDYVARPSEFAACLEKRGLVALDAFAGRALSQRIIDRNCCQSFNSDYLKLTYWNDPKTLIFLGSVISDGQHDHYACLEGEKQEEPGFVCYENDPFVDYDVQAVVYKKEFMKKILAESV